MSLSFPTLVEPLCILKYPTIRKKENNNPDHSTPILYIYQSDDYCWHYFQGGTLKIYYSMPIYLNPMKIIIY